MSSEKNRPRDVMEMQSHSRANQLEFFCSVWPPNPEETPHASAQNQDPFNGYVARYPRCCSRSSLTQHGVRSGPFGPALRIPTKRANLPSTHTSVSRTPAPVCLAGAWLRVLDHYPSVLRDHRFIDHELSRVFISSTGAYRHKTDWGSEPPRRQTEWRVLNML